VSIEEAYRRVRATGCVYGSPEELKAQLADIAAYLGTKDPIELGAALLLEQAGYEPTQLQLALAGGPPLARLPRRTKSERSNHGRTTNPGRDLGRHRL
jgi:hypothetical protein